YNGSILYPEVKFIMLTVFDDDDKLFEAIKAGASGYFLKDEKITTILEGLKQAIYEEGAPMSPRIARKTLNLMVNPLVNEKSVTEPSDLSNREMEILKLLVQGSDYKAIAEKLFISPNTVRKHIANIYTKLQVSSKIQLVNLAAKNNW
ncbi:MAG: response regulator transcription factor, partial [Chitinophagales bacterium]